MSSLLGRSSAAVLAVAASLLLVAGCAGRAEVASPRTPLPTPVSASPTATPSATPTPASTATPDATPTPEEPTASPIAPSPAAPAPEASVPEAPAPAAPAPAPVARCHGGDLSLEYLPDPEASGAGSSAFDLVFTNVSSLPCTLAGIPGVYPTDADGVRIGAVAAAVGPNPGGLLTLQPAGRAEVRVVRHSPGAYGCPSAVSARIVAEVVDDLDPAVSAPAALEVCTDGTVVLEASTYTPLG
ncbi:DUF4232 domain-containing protein [Rathayibacter sp. SD072]|uniref:DUF4232 domain-containing protein n=1 Tax=Rathayibacter sp. SD072 TaxID=2781731 RepID=UPI001A977BD2|nr:DUF4232 domain-containing protein [Rathayibacter sp. SD072]MBO0984705.1 DUF4232 domain-containing protein [Rathayibacter sp. SD072]